MRITSTRPLTSIRRYPLDAVITLLNLLVPLTILLVMISGDHLLTIRPSAEMRILWRLMDPLTHVTIGFLVISPFIFYRPVTWRDLLFASVLVAASIAPDVDHVIAAGSLSLNAITQVIPRTPFHSVFNAVVAGLLCWLVSRNFCTGWLFFAAITSHFLRDAFTGGMLAFPWSSGVFHLELTEYRLLEILLYLATNVLIYCTTVLLPSGHGRWWRLRGFERRPTAR